MNILWIFIVLHIATIFSRVLENSCNSQSKYDESAIHDIKSEKRLDVKEIDMHKLEKLEGSLWKKSENAIEAPHRRWMALNLSVRSREAVNSIKRQRNQIAGAENVRRRRIAAFRGSNQGGIECVCYDASLGSPHNRDKCIIGAHECRRHAHTLRETCAGVRMNARMENP